MRRNSMKWFMPLALILLQCCKAHAEDAPTLHRTCSSIEMKVQNVKYSIEKEIANMLSTWFRSTTITFFSYRARKWCSHVEERLTCWRVCRGSDLPGRTFN